MSEMSRRFNFDDFDKQIAEALEEHDMTRAELDAKMAAEDAAWEDDQRWADYDRVFYPGQIGGVVTRLSWQGDDPLASPIEPVTDWPEPPEAA